MEPATGETGLGCFLNGAPDVQHVGGEELLSVLLEASGSEPAGIAYPLGLGTPPIGRRTLALEQQREGIQ